MVAAPDRPIVSVRNHLANVGLFAGLPEGRGALVKVFIARRLRIVNCVGVAATWIVRLFLSAIVRVERDFSADVLIITATFWREFRYSVRRIYKTEGFDL